jgi:hypothetical protein
MPLSTHGGADLAVEIDQDLITDLARLSFLPRTTEKSIGNRPTPDDNDRFVGIATIRTDLVAVWFTEEPPYVGSLQRSRATTNRVTLTLSVNGRLLLERVRTALGWLELPPSLGTVPLEGFIDITDRVEARRLRIAVDRANPTQRRRAWCAIIDLNNDRTGGMDPVIEVRINWSRFFSPILLQGLTDEERAAIRDDLTRQVSEAVRPQLQAVEDWRIDSRGIAILNAQVEGSGSAFGATGLAVRTITTVAQARASSSLVLLTQTTGSGGNPAVVTRSALEDVRDATIGTGVNVPVNRYLNIQLPNSTLLRGVVLPALNRAFVGDTLPSWGPGVPIFLTRPHDVVALEPYTLGTLIAGVNESNRVQINGTIRLSRWWGTAGASFAIQLRLFARTDIARGMPVLTVVPIVASSQVSDAWASVYWWVHAVFPGISFAIQEIIRGIVFSQISDTLPTSLAQGLEIPLPGGVDFPPIGVEVNLFQVAAPRGTITIGPPPTPPIMLPSPLRDHDLNIVLPAQRLPTELTVTCVTLDEQDVDRRLDAIGGRLPNGAAWGMAIDDAVAAVSSGAVTMVAVAPGASAVPVVVRRSTNGLPYLTTETDADPRNNLAALPPCPR